MVAVANRESECYLKYSSDRKEWNAINSLEDPYRLSKLPGGYPIEQSTSVTSDCGTEDYAQSTTPISLHAEEVIRRALELDVRVPDPRSVRKYLSMYVDIADLTEVLFYSALDRFGSNSQLSLELYQSREYDDEYLKICVRQSPYEKDLIDQIEELSALFDELLCRVSGWVQITTDFRPPE